MGAFISLAPIVAHTHDLDLSIVAASAPAECEPSLGSTRSSNLAKQPMTWPSLWSSSSAPTMEVAIADPSSSSLFLL